MQKSDKSQKATASRRKVQASTARNRKTVKKAKPEIIIEKVEANNAPVEKIEVTEVEASEAAEAKKTKVETEAKPVEKSPKITKFNIEVVEEESKLEEAIKKEAKPSTIINVVELEDEEEEELAEELTEETETTQGSAEQSSEKTEVETQEEAVVAEKIEDEASIAEETSVAEEAQVELPQANMARVYSRMRERTQEPARVSKQSAQEIKKQEIDKALASVAKRTEKQIREKPQRQHMRMDWKRLVLALSCAAAAVAAIVYFVNLNAPDISLRVAAMQTGIEASYPSYIPRDYSLSDISSESGKVVLNFKNSTTGAAYSIIEEKSSWDSDALLTNFVRKTYGDDYSTIKEQGLTIYIAGSNAAWVNGGVVYKIKTTSGSLTKKQITTIATSL